MKYSLAKPLSNIKHFSNKFITDNKIVNNVLVNLDTFYELNVGQIYSKWFNYSESDNYIIKNGSNNNNSYIFDNTKDFQDFYFSKNTRDEYGNVSTTTYYLVGEYLDNLQDRVSSVEDTIEFFDSSSQDVSELESRITINEYNIYCTNTIYDTHANNLDIHWSKSLFDVSISNIETNIDEIETNIDEIETNVTNIETELVVLDDEKVDKTEYEKRDVHTVDYNSNIVVGEQVILCGFKVSAADLRAKYQSTESGNVYFNVNITVNNNFTGQVGLGTSEISLSGYLYVGNDGYINISYAEEKCTSSPFFENSPYVLNYNNTSPGFTDNDIEFEIALNDSYESNKNLNDVINVLYTIDMVSEELIDITYGDGALSTLKDINTKYIPISSSDLYYDSTDDKYTTNNKRIEVADAIENEDVVNKGQLDTATATNYMQNVLMYNIKESADTPTDGQLHYENPGTVSTTLRISVDNVSIHNVRRRLQSMKIGTIVNLYPKTKDVSFQMEGIVVSDPVYGNGVITVVIDNAAYYQNFTPTAYILGAIDFVNDVETYVDLTNYIKAVGETRYISTTGAGSFGGVLKEVVVEYADNAAAITAGLSVGTHYRTGDLLKIVH